MFSIERRLGPLSEARKIIRDAFSFVLFTQQSDQQIDEHKSVVFSAHVHNIGSIDHVVPDTLADEASHFPIPGLFRFLQDEQKSGGKSKER
jgi:hypothetical protein